MTTRVPLVNGWPLGIAEFTSRPPIPLYYRVWEDIYNRIVAGVLKPGDQLPPERELEIEYGVSRTTVRTALRELEERQLIVRRQGHGTVVAHPRIYLQGTSLVTLAEDLGPAGSSLRAELIEAATIPALPQVAQSLGLAMHAPVLHVLRRRTLFGEPVSASESHYPEWVAKRLTNEHLCAGSILEILERDFHIPLVEADHYLEATYPSQRMAELLGVTANTPSLVVTRTTYSVAKRPVAHARHWYRGDRVGYRAHVQRLIPTGE